MRIDELTRTPGAVTEGKRKGRGPGTGNGKTAGKGHKGQKARSGAPHPGFEGGQMPLHRRLPKRGFVNIFAKEYAVINLSDLDKFDKGAVVDAQSLLEAGVIAKAYDGIKVLGNGKLSKAVTVKATKVSKAAQQSIEKAGGKVEVI